MKNKSYQLIWILSAFIILTLSASAQQVVGCFTSGHKLVSPNHDWRENYNGVMYHCVCNSDGTTSCSKESSSSHNSSSGGNNLNEQLMQSVVAPVMQNFFNWLFSAPDDNQQDQQQTQIQEPTAEDLARMKAENEEYQRKAAEYQAKMKEQVDKLNKEYSNSLKEKFEDQKKSTINDIKNKIAQSDAIKNIKQLNCAAYTSLEAAKMISKGEIDFKELNGVLENSSKLADFTVGKKSGCPDVKKNVQEVTALNPIGFQQAFYETIKQKADSITVSVALLKVKEEKIKTVINEKDKVVEELKNKPDKNREDDQSMKDALKLLHDALEDEKKVNEELARDEKNIERIEKVRSVYDIKKPG